MFEKILNIPRKALYLVLMIVIILPLFLPLGLAIRINRVTRDAYNAIDALPPGSTILFDETIAYGGYPDMGLSSEAVLRHALKNGVKVVFVTVGMRITLLRTIEAAAKGYTYGTDYVYLGFIPGGETAMASLAASVWNTAPSDYYGTPLSELPIMQDIRTAKDFDLFVIASSDFDMVYAWIRQWHTTYNIPTVVLCSAGHGAFFMPYYPEQMKGIVISIRGAAEYELLIKRPGVAVSSLDQLNLSAIFFAALVILGNVGQIMSKRK